MYTYLEVRHKMLEARPNSFSKHFNGAGVVEWARVVPWKFKWEGAKVIEVSHDLLGSVALCFVFGSDPS